MLPFDIYVYFVCVNIILFVVGANHYNRSLRNIKTLQALFGHLNANRNKILKDLKRIKLNIKIRQHITVDLLVVVLIVQLFFAELVGKYDVSAFPPVLMFLVFMTLLLLFYSLKGGSVLPNRTRSSSGYTIN